MEEVLIKRAAEAILASGADFVKICSGMGPRGASLEDVKTWFRSYYGPNNAVLVLAGYIDARLCRTRANRGRDDSS